ncbi:MAG: hypothetical protein FWC41_07840, partial [Firmicutes bacterium]|nr:hypothetical protein [Bacillota bacterium]
MINLENLNDKTEIEIFDEARKKINIINPDWTYQGESDPGITLLELLSWLKFSQHEYLNKISPLTEIKLLKLLGINLKKRRGSRTLIQISNLYVDMDVPKNTKWFADKLVFENNHEQFLVKSDVLSLKFVNPEFENIENFYNLDGTKKIFLFGENNLKFNEQREFFINLSSPFPKDKTVNLYFEIFQSNEFTRNQIDPTCFYPMAKINWQYWGTTSEKKIKWVDLEFNDFTNQFLFSGIVSIKHYGKMEPLNGIYCIKVKLINSDYDFMPQITKINLNVFEVIQKDTKCESIFIKKNEIKSSENKMKIQIYTHLSIYGEQILYIKKKKSWVIFKNFNTSKNYKDGYLSIFFDSLDNLENFEDDEYVFMLISFSNDIKDKIIIGNATGFSGLTFNTNF